MLDHFIKYGTLIVGVVISIIGYLASDTLTKINEGQKALWSVSGEQSKIMMQVSKDMAVIGASFAAHVKEDDGFDAQVKQTLADHETRIRAREAAPWKDLRPH